MRERKLLLWKYNRITGYWRAERDVSPETAQQWLTIFRDDEPRESFKISASRPSGPPKS
jgi:hypothetical protein